MCVVAAMAVALLVVVPTGPAVADGYTACPMTGYISFSEPVTLNAGYTQRDVSIKLRVACSNPDPLRPADDVARIYALELGGVTGMYPTSCIGWEAGGTAVDVRGTGAGSTLSGNWSITEDDELPHSFTVLASQTDDRDYDFYSAITWTSTPTSGNCVQGAWSFSIEGVTQLFVYDGPSWDLTPPVLVSPAAGHTTGREGMVVFTVRAEDLKGAATYRAWIEVRNGAGTLVSYGVTNEATQNVAVTGTTTWPLPAGDYTWTAEVQTTGYSSAQSAPRTLTVASSAAPSAPVLVSPAAGQVVAAQGPQPFTVRATDPDGDPYVGVITVRDGANAVVRTIRTAATASGTDATGHPISLLPVGSYTWSAHAEDALGAAGPESASAGFSVAGSGPPTAPVLVSPSSGDYSFGEPATFTVRADDPDLDPYRAFITVRHSDGTEYDITSLYAASGTEASGSPSTILPAGVYTWWAVGEDVRGNIGPQSETGTFTVTTSFTLLLL